VRSSVQSGLGSRPFCRGGRWHFFFLFRVPSSSLAVGKPFLDRLYDWRVVIVANSWRRNLLFQATSTFRVPSTRTKGTHVRRGRSSRRRSSVYRYQTRSMMTLTIMPSDTRINPRLESWSLQGFAFHRPARVPQRHRVLWSFADNMPVV
jgi:hypothetical protein